MFTRTLFPTDFSAYANTVFPCLPQLQAIGLPDIPRERIQFIGNSSLAGARKALLSRAPWARAQEIASMTTCLELTTESAYFEEYTAALFLPHTDLPQFPSTGNF